MADRSFLESLFDPVDQAKEARYLEIADMRNEDRKQSLKSQQTKYENNSKWLEDHGEMQAPEAQPGGLVKLLDVLDTPHQWVSGIAGKLAGAEGYKDESFLGAAQKGSNEDVYVAKMLRENPFFKEHPFVRGAAGFAGDVLLDPLTYLSFGEGQAARLGGAAVTDKAIGVAGKTPLEIAEGIRSAKKAEALPGYLKQYEGSIANATPEAANEFRQLAEGKAGLDAENDVYKKFSDARNLIAERRKLRAAGVVDLAQTAGPQMRSAAELMEPELASKAQDIQTALGLAHPDDIELLFKPKAIRFTNPLAGLTTHGKLPIFHTREADIPLITGASEKMYKALDQVYYGGVHKVGGWMDAAKTASETSPTAAIAHGAFTVLNGAREKMVNMAALVSRRVQSTGELFGSSARLEDLKENERARNMLLHMTMQESNLHGRHVLKFGDAPEMFESASRALQKKDPLAALDDLRSKYNAIEPGKGDAIANFGGFVKTEFDRLGKEALDKGLIDNVTDGYLMHMYDFSNGLPKSQFDSNFGKLKKLFTTNEGGTDFTFDKVFQTMEQAKLAGLKPDENLLNIYTARRYWQERILSEKDFMERLSYTHGIPANVYAKLSSIAADVASSERGKAAQALASLDLVEDPTKFEGFTKKMLPEGVSFNVYKRLKQAVDNPKTDPFFPAVQHYVERYGLDFSDREAVQMSAVKHLGTDELLTPESYENLRNVLKDPNDPFYADAKRQASYMQLDFSPEEAAKVQAQHEAYKSTIEIHPGRKGERVYARAGATTVSDLASKHFLKHVPEGDKQFWGNLLPQSLVDSVHESYATYDVMKRKVFADTDSPATKVFKGILDFAGFANRWMKVGAIAMWPSYYSRNYTSAPFQGLEAASALGSQLNIFNIYRAHKALNSGADMVINGVKISAGQFRQEMAQANIFHKLNDTVDLTASMGDMMEQMSKSPGLMATMPGLKAMAKQDRPWLKQSEGWSAVKAGLSLADKSWSKFQTFAQKLEAHGRAHLYYNLRSSGYDAKSAGARVNQLMIDYANGKTAFEKNALNNVFFFYSFSRGQATNNMMALARKPGALTTQLHAHHAIAETLMQPDAFFSDPDYEEQIRTTRTSESLATYIGDNPKTGLPQMVTQTGLPIEDTAKWMNVAYPRTWGEAINAGADSAHRTLALTASQLNPWIKWPLEVLLTKQNLFFDRPITDRQLRNVPKWEKDLPGILHYPFGKVPDAVWKGMDTVTQKALGGRDNGDGTFTVDPYRLSVLTYLVPAASRIIDTRRALTKSGVDAGPKALRFLTGVHVDETDPESSVKFDKVRRQEDYMDSLGIAKSKRDREIADKYGDNEEED
jgi:hypothetical protein